MLVAKYTLVVKRPVLPRAIGPATLIRASRVKTSHQPAVAGTAWQYDLLALIRTSHYKTVLRTMRPKNVSTNRGHQLVLQAPHAVAPVLQRFLVRPALVPSQLREGID